MFLKQHIFIMYGIKVLKKFTLWSQFQECDCCLMEWKRKVMGTTKPRFTLKGVGAVTVLCIWFLICLVWILLIYISVRADCCCANQRAEQMRMLPSWRVTDVLLGSETWMFSLLLRLILYSLSHDKSVQIQVEEMSSLGTFPLCTSPGDFWT